MVRGHTKASLYFCKVSKNAILIEDRYNEKNLAFLLFNLQDFEKNIRQLFTHDMT